MRVSDLGRILTIERRAFADPWGPSAFLAELRNPRAHRLVVRSRSDGKVVAYAVGWIAGDELSIANLAVEPHARQRGLGRALVQALVAWGYAIGARRAYLEVRRSNRPARALYESLGFSQVGIRAGYYGSDGEDALLLGLDLGPSREPVVEGESWP